MNICHISVEAIVVSIHRLSSGPYFSYYSLLFFFCAPSFPYFFSENALLSLLFSPKMFEVTENCNFFHVVFALSQFLKIRST